MEQYYQACGAIDQHNGFRQGNLRLEKFHKTLKWNRRCLVSILSSTMVDAFKAYEYHFPPSADSNASSRITGFVAKVIDKIKPGATHGLSEVQEGCYLEKIGTTTSIKGKNLGREYAIQQRCKICQRNRPDGDKTRCRRTVWRCHYHPNIAICPAGKYQCLALHQRDQGQI